MKKNSKTSLVNFGLYGITGAKVILSIRRDGDFWWELIDEKQINDITWVAKATFADEEFELITYSTEEPSIAQWRDELNILVKEDIWKIEEWFDFLDNMNIKCGDNDEWYDDDGIISKDDILKHHFKSFLSKARYKVGG